LPKNALSSLENFSVIELLPTQYTQLCFNPVL